MLKMFLVVWAFLLNSYAAFGDGFICHSMDMELGITVYNQVRRELGTRNAAVMILSDETVESPDKTIAVFRDSTLSSKSLKYTAKVDMRFRESSRGGELIAGTKLAELRTVVLVVDFVYGKRLSAGDEVDAIAHLNKRDGEQISLDMVCSRYLKN
jgi:hypothetical protein